MSVSSYCGDMLSGLVHTGVCGKSAGVFSVGVPVSALSLLLEAIDWLLE